MLPCVHNRVRFVLLIQPRACSSILFSPFSASAEDGRFRKTATCCATKLNALLVMGREHLRDASWSHISVNAGEEAALNQALLNILEGPA